MIETQDGLRGSKNWQTLGELEVTFTGRPALELRYKSNGESPSLTPTGSSQVSSCLIITLGLTVKLCVTRDDGFVAASPRANASRVQVPALSSLVVIESTLNVGLGVGAPGKQIVGVNELTDKGIDSEEAIVVVRVGLSRFCVPIEPTNATV